LNVCRALIVVQKAASFGRAMLLFSLYCRLIS
jgi:hypothetical protein